MTKDHGSRFIVAGMLVAIIMALSLAPGLGAQSSTRAIYGRWKVKRIIPTSNIQTSTEDAKKYVGMEIVYSAEQFKFGSDVVEHPKYKAGKLAADAFYENYRLPLKEIGVAGDSVATIEVRDAKGEAVTSLGANVFVRNANVMVTMWDGIYFEAVREGGAARVVRAAK